MKTLFTLFFAVYALGLNAQTFTWTEQNSGVSSNFNDVFFVDNMKGWAVGENGTIVATTDGGENWATQTSGSDQPLRAVFFLDAQTGWIAGGNLSKALLKTSDGGVTWQDIAPANIFPNQFHDIAFNDANTGWLISRDSIYMTADGGMSWMGESYISSVSQVSNRAIAVTSDSTAFIASRTKRATPSSPYADVLNKRPSAGSREFGASVGSIRSADQQAVSIEFVDYYSGFFGSSDGSLYKLNVLDSANLSADWIVNFEVPGGGGIYSISFSEKENGMFQSSVPVGNSSSTLIYHTADNGETWSTPDSIMGLLTATVHSPDANTAWVVGSLGKIYKGSSITTSISDRDLGLDARVYPNPTSGLLNVSVDSKGMELVKYGLWDISGRKLKQGEQTASGPNSTFSINVSDVPNGVYLFRVNTDGESNTFRVLKK